MRPAKALLVILALMHSAAAAGGPEASQGAGSDADRSAKRLAELRLRYRRAPRAAKKSAGLGLLDALLDGAETAEAARRWTRAKDLYRQAHSLARYLRSPLEELAAFRRARADHFEAVARRVEVEKSKLAAPKTAAAARERLLEMLVIELRDLPEARKLLTDQVRQIWRSYLPLAGRDPQKLSEPAAAELARWYHEFLAPKASKFSQLEILLAAKACCRRALKLHEADDAARKALADRLADLQEQLNQYAMYPTAGGRGADIDLLRSLDVERLQPRGAWDFSHGRLTTWPRYDGCLRLPATVTGNYRLSLRFMNRNHIPLPDRFRKFERLRVSERAHRWFRRLLDPSPGVNVALPVGERHVALSVLPQPRARKTKAVLAIVEPPIDYDDEDEEAAEEPAATQPAAAQPAAAMPNDAGPSLRETITVEAPYISRERYHQLDVAVFVEHGVATIVVNLNEKPLIRWEGEASRLVLDDIWPAAVPRGAILLGGWRGPTAFSSAKVCNFSGRTRLDRPAP